MQEPNSIIPAGTAIRKPKKDFRKRHPGAGDEESGFHQELILLKLAPNRYKFWLYVIKGFPSYNSGQTEGIITIAGDSAVFHTTDSVLSFDCKLVFHLQKLPR